MGALLTGARRRWAVLVVIALAQLMVVLDSTIVNIALPSAQRDLGFGDADRQWIITAYALAFGSLLLLGGRLGDAVGRKRTFVIGGAGFALASAVGGAAQSFAMLASARAAQGVFGALLAPAALSLLSTTFTTPAERNKAFAVFGAIASSGASIGLILGGALTQALDWRFSMYVNVIFAALAVGGALLLLEDEPRLDRRGIDVLSSTAVSAGLFGLVFGFSHAQTASWSSLVTIASIAGGAVLLGAFVSRQARIERPLLPLRIITARTRAASFATIAIMGAGVFAVMIFLTYYLQQVHGYSPMTTGLAYLPMTLSLVVASMLGNVVLRPRVGVRTMVVYGMALAAAGLAWLTQLSVSSSYGGAVLPALLLLGVGLGCVASSAFTHATDGVDREDAGVASAMLTASQQVGGSLGVAVLSTVAITAGRHFAAGHHGAGIAASAVVHGYTIGFGCAAVIFLAGAALAALLFQPRQPSQRNIWVGDPVVAS
jgi:EmrB/QacA subfamily drug resistance transporter